MTSEINILIELFLLYDPIWSETYFVKKSGQISRESRAEVKGLQRKEGIEEVLLKQN